MKPVFFARLLLLIPTVAGCDALFVGTLDADRDEIPAGRDCDDLDAEVAPGLEEACDGKDNDCDGDVDEGLVETWYPDADGDGWGRAEGVVWTCDPATGLVEAAGDCDDALATAWPGAAEACDGIDNDCDGDVDEGLTRRYWLDADADGYGDDTAPLDACDFPVGYADTAGDCDDADAAVSPGVGGDAVGNGVDDDCDGLYGCYLDGDEDGYGNDDGEIVQGTDPECASGGVSLDATDCNDRNARVFPGASEQVDKGDWNCDGLQSCYQDLDQDTWGNDDIIVSAANCTVEVFASGEAGDCDDTSAEVSPDAEEVCNYLDDNCNSTVDEGVRTTCYPDTDGDLFGDAAVHVRECSCTLGWVKVSTDCDDTDPAVHPGALEFCNEQDDNCDGLVDDADPLAVERPTWYTDGDADGTGGFTGVDACLQPEGTVAVTGDCDDADASIHPDADEWCNAIDDDCDGVIDPDSALDAPTWYADLDGDGYGLSEDFTRAACTAPSGYTATPGDCNEGDPDIHPGAWDACDGVDADCDGVAESPLPWFQDTDGDGWGVFEDAVWACEQPTGTVTACCDCDDADTTIHPNAGSRCDGTDADCDGFVHPEEDVVVWFEDLDGDGYGGTGTASGGCAPPSGYVAEGTDCDDLDASVSPDRAEVPADGVDNDCDGRVDPTVFYLDADGDGWGDASDTSFVEGPGFVADDQDCDDGDADVHPGAVDRCGDLLDADCDGSDAGCAVDLGDTTSLAVAWTGAAAGDSAGFSLATGDLDGDGVGDFATGACNADVAGTNAGTVHVVYGPLPRTGEASLSTADVIVQGPVASASAGYALAIGDGILAVGAPTSTTARGEVFLLPAPLDPAIDLATAAAFTGRNTYDSLGAAVLFADFTADGVEDLVIGASSRNSAAGEVYVWEGPLASLASDIVPETDAATWAAWAGESSSTTGIWLSHGDLDGDGLVDLAVSGTRTGGSAGAVYLVPGGTSPGAADLVTVAWTLRGADAEGLGTSTAFGDLDGDGRDDLAVGAYRNEAGAVLGGSVWILHGDVPPGGPGTEAAIADVTTGFLAGNVPYGALGTGLAILPDLHGDGWGDLLAGAKADGEATATGDAWLFHGPLLGTFDLEDDCIRLAGGDAGEWAGHRVGRVDDADGAGTTMLLVAAPLGNGGGAGAGAVRGITEDLLPVF